MSFIQVQDAKQKKELIDQYIKNRDVLKKRIYDEKVRKQEFQRDVAAPLQEPITKQVEKQLKERQKQTDENQSRLIRQLQQNQLAITGKISDNKDEMLAKVLENQAAIVRSLSSLPIEEAPKDSDVGESPPKSDGATNIIPVDWNKNLDLAILDEEGLEYPSKLVLNPDDIRKNFEKAGHINRVNGGK